MGRYCCKVNYDYDNNKGCKEFIRNPESIEYKACCVSCINRKYVVHVATINNKTEEN